ASNSIVLDKNPAPLSESGAFVEDKVAELLGATKIDAVFNVAGGWAGGSLSDREIYTNAPLMFSQSVNSSLVVARLSALHLKEGGLLTLVGANAALAGTPGMIGYGMAKAAVHHLVKSAAEEGSGLPKGARVNAYVLITLDTPNNRKYMPDADFSTWTSPEDIAKQFVFWVGATDLPSGTLYSVVTKNSVTEFVPVK
ncbi:hypothetical protein BDK51DRAFT_20978, partial [Blyttiomyces helicus]